MRRIIDFHTHLGDIFHDNQNIAFKRPYLSHPDTFDPFGELEENGFAHPLVVDDQQKQNVLIDAGLYRVWDRGNLFTTRECMDRCGIVYMVSLPILPNTSFEDALAASILEPRLVPFTCPDFGLPDDKMLEKLRQDIANGARGLKIHPILQNIAITDPRCAGPIELFGERGLPVTWHCGVNDYYRPDSPYLRQTNKAFGALHYTMELLRRYSDFVLVPAHGGGSCGGEMEQLAETAARLGCKNLYIESSNRGAPDIVRALELFGEDRVMYGTDWPFGTPDYSIRYLERALADRPEQLDKVFYQNAARILRLDD